MIRDVVWLVLFCFRANPPQRCRPSPRGGRATALRTKPEEQQGATNSHASPHHGPSKLGGQWPPRPPTRVLPPPPQEAPECHTQETAARHPTTMAVGLSQGGYTTPAKDFSSGDPVLPGSHWVTSRGPALRSTAGPYPPEAGTPQGKILSPHPQLRAWGTTALQRACFPGTPESTQRHRCPQQLTLQCSESAN